MSTEAKPYTALSNLGEMIGVKLDAVDFSVTLAERAYDEDANVCRFRLDGVTYVVTEDPSDGYRSSMRDIFIEKNPEKLNTFEPVLVNTVYAENRRDLVESEFGGDVGCDILQLVDAVSGKVILSVGTDNADDYYPSFVANFQPQNITAGSWAAHVKETTLESASPTDYEAIEDFGAF